MLLDRKLLALSPPAILILRALGLGDFLTAVPAYRALRRAHPAASVVLAAPPGLRPLLDLDCGIDRLLPVAGLGTRRWPIPTPELAVNLHGRGPQSIDDLLATGAPRIITHTHPERLMIPGLDWDEEQHEVARWCRLLASGGVAADPADLLLPAPRQPSPDPGAIVLHPGAASPARRWPVDRFAAVARVLAARGEKVVITGNGKERSLASAVVQAAGLPPDHLLAGTLDLIGLASVVAGARLLVCGDTGVAHLGSAFATPSVLLFGPTPPARWGPPPSGPHRVLWSGTTGDPHATSPDPGLLKITVEQVLGAVRTELERTDLAPRIREVAPSGTSTVTTGLR